MMVALEWLCIIAAYAQRVQGDSFSTNYEEYNNGKFGGHPRLVYQSTQEYSPLLQVNTWNESAIDYKAGSHIFLKHDGDGPSSPLILDAKDLSAVYMNRSFPNVFGTSVQENFGRKYLTFWEGEKGSGIGNGFGLAYDDTYRLVYNISAQGISAHADLHEFAFTGHGTALVTGVDEVVTDLSQWPGWTGFSKSRVLCSVFQEIDLETNELLFSWRALDHINPRDSFEKHGSGWDIYHMNSIQKTKAGNYLISIRHTYSILLIDGKTGHIIWSLGGKQNNFTEIPPPEGTPMAPLLGMHHQHHARFLPNTDETEMTLFDNHGHETSYGKCKTDCSRGLHIAINDTVSPPTVQLLKEYFHPSQVKSQSQGSVQPLSSSGSQIGNVFIGWGHSPSFTEHTPSGEVVMDVQFAPWESYKVPESLDNYRAFKLDWVATPWWDPAIALIENVDTEDLDIYVSWNGATEVSEWVVRGERDTVLGTTRGDILAQSSKTGFETKLTVEKTKIDEVQYIWAEAVHKNGSSLRSTDVWGWDDSGEMVIVKTGNKPSSTNVTADTILPEWLKTWMLLGLGGILGISLGLTIGYLLWRRQGSYDRLGAQDVDADVDADVNSAVLELDDLEDGVSIVSSQDDNRADKEEIPNPEARGLMRWVK